MTKRIQTADERTSQLVEYLCRSLPRLTQAVRMKTVEASSAGFVSGGAPSFELVSLSALSLLQDLRRHSARHEQAVRALPGLHARAYHPARDLPASLRHLAQALATAQEQRLSAPTVTEARHDVGAWARRCALVLRDARAPYRLIGPDGALITCPVIEQGPELAYVCGGALMVHRDDATGVPRSIICTRHATHEWPQGPAWMRLGALLGVLS